MLEDVARDLEANGTPLPAGAIEELEASAAELVRLYLGRPQPVRPSAVARELRIMANALERAARAAEKAGQEGMLMVLLASNANREPDDTDPAPHVAYLRRMARWARRAADTATDASDTARDRLGGRTPDVSLRSLVVLLADRYRELLGVTPTHVLDPDTGRGISPFDSFVREMIRRYAPEGVHVAERLVDDAISRALPSRATEHFRPPAGFLE